MMKRTRILVLGLAVMLLLALPAAAMADHLSGNTAWQVTFTSEKKMVDNFSEKQWADDIGRLQPGDDITFTVNLKQEHPTSCDWYMANEVLKSLEEGVASGSAYSYYLTYTSPAGVTRVLYDSSRLGGDDSDEGLGDATSGLKDFFFLDNLKKDQTAQVQLVVGLDGETEGNAYFDTLARLKMKFAVEMDTETTSSTKTTTSSRTTVQTGDDTNLFPFFVAMAVSGVLLLALAVYSLRTRKREEKEVRR